MRTPKSILRTPTTKSTQKNSFINISKFKDSEWIIQDKILFGRFIPNNAKYITRVKQMKIDYVVYLDSVLEIFEDDKYLYEFIEELFTVYLENKKIFICCDDGYDKSGFITGLLLKRIGFSTKDVFIKLSQNICQREICISSLSPTNTEFRKKITEYSITAMPVLEI